MPVFSSQTPALMTDGPIVKADLFCPTALATTLQANNIALPTPIPISAMIDTGASITAVKKGLPSQLGLNPIGTQSIGGVSSVGVRCYKYLMRMSLHGAAGHGQVNYEGVFVEVELKGQNIDCLLGRDFLSGCIFVYSGPANSITLAM